MCLEHWTASPRSYLLVHFWARRSAGDKMSNIRHFWLARHVGVLTAARKYSKNSRIPRRMLLIIHQLQTGIRNEEEQLCRNLQLPRIRTRLPEIWRAFSQLAQACHDAGPLDEKTRRLVQLAIAVAAERSPGSRTKPLEVAAIAAQAKPRIMTTAHQWAV
jgi:alkylhydroperoxidase/carboxymuconolactone decarboxylase family protein YurZ